MKKHKYLFFILFILFLSCASHKNKTTSTYPTHHNTSSHYDRLKNVAFLGYISDRSVLVKRDCNLKKDVFYFGGGNPNKALDGYGSGSIITSYSNKSYIFTAAHVVSIKGRLEKGFDCSISVVSETERLFLETKQRNATIVSIDKKADIAVLSVDVDYGVNSRLELSPVVGESVWAVGYPVQLLNRKSVHLSVTKGTIATVDVSGKPKDDNHGLYHRVTSQVYFGNSGGGIWTIEGKLVSVVVVLYKEKNSPPYEGYYYTKPVIEIIELLGKDGKIRDVFRS
jgi:S1-C subfamily serine protease